MPVYYESRKNKRRTNQDYHLYMEYRVNHEAMIKAMLVADGMGGLACGEVASDLAGRKWMLKLHQLTMSKDFLGKTLNEQIEQLKLFSYKVVKEINEEVYQELNDKGITGGTTLSTAILYWDTLIFSNCGDSPAFYYNGQEKRVCKISREQNAAEELLAEGKVEKNSPEYWKHKNMLTDYIGKYRQSNPYTASIPFRKGDLILIGSDGAYGKLDESEIGRLMEQYYHMPDRLIKNIMEEAEKQGEEDNQTLVCYMEEMDEQKEESPKEKRGFFRKRRAVKSCIR